MLDAAAEAKSQKTRSFLIGIMMNIFISLTVFAIGTYYFVIPRLYDHEKRLNDVREWARQQKMAQQAPQEEVAEAPPAEGAAAAPAEGAAPAAPEAAAPAPAPAAAAK
jgi:hypothetical protein